MARNDWIDGGPMLSKNSRSARLVGAHQPAISGHIGGQDTCESAFDAALPRSGHGVASRRYSTPPMAILDGSSSPRRPPAASRQHLPSRSVMAPPRRSGDPYDRPHHQPKVRG